MSLPSYPRYEASGVEWLGNVPAHWVVRRVKDIAGIINGFPFDSKLFAPDGAYPLIRIRDLNRHRSATRYAGELIHEAIVTSDDVLIGMDGDFNVGRWLGDEPALLNQRMCCVRTSDQCLSTILCHALPTPLKAINDVTYSTTVKHLSSLDVAKIRVALPTEEAELAAIAWFLDRETAKIDALIAEQEKLLALLAEKRQATISHAVTRGLDPNAPMKDSGIPWLGEVPIHWEVLPLRRVAQSVVTGRTPTSQSPSSDVPDGVEWFTPGDFDGDLDLSSAERLVSSAQVVDGEVSVYPKNSVFVVSIGATLGKVGLTTQPASANQQINIVVFPQSVEARFFAYSLSVKAEVMRFLSNASTIGIMNQSKTNEILLAIPSHVEQVAIWRFLDGEVERMNQVQSEVIRAIVLLKERRCALISAAVTGKIDVRGLVESEAA